MSVITENKAAATKAPPKTLLNGTSTFALRREDIFKRLQQSAEKCRATYSERKELATEQDIDVADLCDALEDAFTYGLQPQPQPQLQLHTRLTPPLANVAVTAVNILQNVQEILTGNLGISTTNNDFTFWDFCEMHLTPHERERYKDLKYIWTKSGRAKAFIRATLNEHSLQRYLLTWLYDTEQLPRYYSAWSLLLDTEARKELPKIIGSLDKVLFAITIDANELNNATRTQIAPKDEPIIYAPAPIPVNNNKNKRAVAIERHIHAQDAKDDALNLKKNIAKILAITNGGCVNATEELMSQIVIDNQIEKLPPTDPIEPELEFLKQPLPDFYPETHDITSEQTLITTCNAEDAAAAAFAAETKSDTSSLSANDSASVSTAAAAVAAADAAAADAAATQAALEEKLREVSERCAFLETRVSQLSLENRQLVRKLTQLFNETGIKPTSSLSGNFLITIPNVKLLKTKRGASSYYVYEIHITMKQQLEHWMIMRRYREFYQLHKSLLHTHPVVSSVEFPPKKHWGNKNIVFVEERRQQLQIYLLDLVETLPQVEICKTKVELQKVFPFFRER